MRNKKVAGKNVLFFLVAVAIIFSGKTAYAVPPTLPVVSEVTAIGNTNDTTPGYTFNASSLTGLGTPDWGGSCDGYFSETVGSVGGGNNNFVASTMPEGVYADCTLTVTDSNGPSNTLAITSFTIDTTAPTVGTISITPSVADGSNFIISGLSTISAPVADTGSGLNTASCRYGVTNGASSAITVPGAYNAGTGRCTFTNVDTSAATGIAVAIDDLAGNFFNASGSWVTNFTVDTTAPNAPTASPVGGAYQYSQRVTINAPAGASGVYYTLDGSVPDSSDTVVAGPITINLVDNDTVVLKARAYDNVGNASTIMTQTYTYDENGTEGGKMEEAILAGDIVIEGVDPTNTGKVTYNVDFLLEEGDASVLFPAGTEMTKTGGGQMDLSQIAVDDITNSLKSAYVGNIAGALSVGIPNLKLSFSKNITVTIPVGSAYDGQTLSIFYQSAGENDWTDAATCTVSGGLCIFQTNHATKYSAGDKPDDGDSSDGHSGKNWKFYKEYKKDFKSAKHKKRYQEMKLLKKKNLAAFEKSKKVYETYKGAGNSAKAKLDLKTRELYDNYRSYKGYKKYLQYKDKVGE